METRTPEIIKLKFVVPKFENSQGYCIYLYQNADTKEEVTCVGNNLPKYKNIIFEMSGYWKKTQKYGMNFEVQTYTEIVENNKRSIIAYLSSGIIKGIGSATAENIYARFGKHSLEILEKEPEKLLQVKGVSARKLKKIVASYKEHKVLKELIDFLLPFGITIKQVQKINSTLEITTVQEIMENPYKLCDIRGISVDTVDLIAKKLGYPAVCKERLLAHVKRVLNDNEVNGNTGMEANLFGLALIASLKTSEYNKNTICDYTISLIKDKTLVHRKILYGNTLKTIIFAPDTFRTERCISEKLLSIFSSERVVPAEAEQNLLKICSNSSIYLDPYQLDAATAAVKNNLLIITGGPGTGKTTLIKTIASYITIYEKRPVHFMAPSGRAARRIKESTGYEATTIHKGLHLKVNEEVPEDEKVTFENCTVIIDEMSMVDIFLFNKLLDAVQEGCRLLLVGDVNQLQSVGPGAVLRDIINSSVFPIVTLKKIHRQGGNSMIAANANNIVNGLHEINEGSDFRMVKCENPIDAQNQMVRYYSHLVEKYGVQNIYCICPCKERTAGVKEMNNALQQAVNPAKADTQEFVYGGYKYHAGDPVMHLTNSDEVSNGDIGYVNRIYSFDGDKTMEVVYFGDTYVEYTAENADEVTLAYAFTVHKSQGSENKILLTFLSKCIGKKLLSRNLFNTAITRGKSLDILFHTGDGALEAAIDNDDSENRITSLSHQLMEYGGKFVRIS